MQQLISHYGINKNVYSYATGQYKYLKQNGVMIIGVYDGSTFQGSDKLSMSIMQSNKLIEPVFKTVDAVFCEGDRFTNSTFINTFNPTIVRIKGDGAQGREQRGSSQSERQIKSITTRVNNITADIEFENSLDCFNYLISLHHVYNDN
jgi:hypothetical protein